MGSVKSQGIILKVIEYSETSNIVTAWTREFGKVSLIAKGARRPKSPFESALDVLAFCRLVFIQKPNQTMGILTEAKLERRFRNRRGKLEWLYGGYYVAELLKCFIEEGEANPWLFDLTNQTLERLDQPIEQKPGDTPACENQEIAELNVCLICFEIGLLTALGHFPLLTHCVGCGKKRQTDAVVGFAIGAGGIVCPECRGWQSPVVDLQDAEIQTLTKLKEMIVQPMIVPIGEVGSSDRQTVCDSLPSIGRVQELEGAYEIGSNQGMFPADHKCQQIRRVLNAYLSQMAGRELRVNPFLKHLLFSGSLTT